MTVRWMMSLLMCAALAGCGATEPRNPYFKPQLGLQMQTPPAVIRQPVVPEMLVNCRGHVLVPALGMVFLNRGEAAPPSGQYLREERLEPPYRILPPGAHLSQEHSPHRLNIELDASKRIIGLYCG